MRRSRSPKNPVRGALEVVYDRRRGRIVALRVRGHAGFAPFGRDIVCAAASALILTAARGLRDHCGATPTIADTPAGYSLSLPGGGNALAQAVLATTLAGLQAIAVSYPGHLTVRESKRVAPRPTVTGSRARRAKAKPSSAR